MQRALSNIFFSLLTTLLLLLTSCSSNLDEAASSPSISWVTILGRNEKESLERPPVYHVKVPSHWIHVPPASTESLTDTTKHIDEFFILSDSGHDKIRITIHNFPSDEIEDRIPPAAQVARWKRQFTHLNPTDEVTTPQARGGFEGLFFYGTGTLHNAPHAVMGWSMQLAAEHYRTLAHYATTSPLGRQMQSDYTIKVTGAPALIETHRTEIESFAHSFELLHEVPAASWE
jgi:hypothetical protein